MRRRYRDDELYHFGIKGMKWGVRRYQNKDGSYTSAGLKRHNASMGGSGSSGGSGRSGMSAERKAKIKKAAKIAAGVAGAAALAYGAHRFAKSSTGQKLIKGAADKIGNSKYGKVGAFKVGAPKAKNFTLAQEARKANFANKFAKSNGELTGSTSRRMSNFANKFAGSNSSIVANKNRAANFASKYGKSSSSIVANKKRMNNFANKFAGSNSSIVANKNRAANFAAKYGKSSSSIVANKNRMDRFAAKYGKKTTDVLANKRRAANFASKYGRKSSDIVAGAAKTVGAKKHSLKYKYGVPAAVAAAGALHLGIKHTKDTIKSSKNKMKRFSDSRKNAKNAKK